MAPCRAAIDGRNGFESWRFHNNLGVAHLPLARLERAGTRLAAPGALGLRGLLAAGGASARSSVLEQMVQLYTPPDEHHFFEDDRKRVVDLKSHRMVRVCTGDSRPLVPLEVTYDGESAMIRANDCMRLEARAVFLEPAEPLEPDDVIQAEVEIIS